MGDASSSSIVGPGANENAAYMGPCVARNRRRVVGRVGRLQAVGSSMTT